ncbi:MAG: GNAT family N-acetyltransferase [Nocardioides sp.]|nr:GNAT family N-acetyltransferase [Nocardioides sp.]
MLTPIAVCRAGRRLTGIARAGESWAAAARRIIGRPAYAIDLSGEVKEFGADEWPVVTLRPMVRGDLPLLGRWLRQEHVRPWFEADGEPTPERVADQYGPAVDGDDPTNLWVAEVNGRSVGMAQDYRISDNPEYALLTPDPDAVGFDYLVGEPAWVGRGVGTRMLWSLVTGLRARYDGATAAFAAPDHRNAASLRVLAKIGCTQGTWFDEPQPDGTVTTMIGCTLDLRAVT